MTLSERSLLSGYLRLHEQGDAYLQLGRGHCQ